MIAFVGVLNRFEVAREALEALAARTTPECGITVLDNGSDEPVEGQPWFPDRAVAFRRDENCGAWCLFGWALRILDENGLDPECVAFLHSDLIVWETNWDRRVLRAFRDDPRLGLVGFVGAKKIVRGGGRGTVMLNFQGIRGPRAWDHGFQLPTLEPAACVDGCAMVFRTAFLRRAWDPDWPPHHFYDKELSCRALASGWRVAFVGVACDHLGGETASRERKYHDLARRWCEARGVAPDQDAPGNWDRAVYLEAQRRFLRRWEKDQSFLPVNVREDWSVAHDEWP